MSKRPARPEQSAQTTIAQGSRYNRPRRPLAWAALLIGLVAGLGGGLYYTWLIDPRPETDTQPHQLSDEAKAHYAVAVVLQYQRDSNLSAAVQRLLDLGLGRDPVQAVADIACELAQTGYVGDSAGLRAVRGLRTFYQLQGKSGCADQLIPAVGEPQVVEIAVPTPTPTLRPAPTKTPLQTQAPATPTPLGVVVVPTTRPQRQFEGRLVGTYCDVELSGTIEVRVQDVRGNGIAGERVRVRWDGGEDAFITGLKPERGAAYADFRMTPGRGYTIDMPGLADPIERPLVADSCTTEAGTQAITSYWVLFTQVG